MKISRRNFLRSAFLSIAAVVVATQRSSVPSGPFGKETEPRETRNPDDNAESPLDKLGLRKLMVENGSSLEIRLQRTSGWRIEDTVISNPTIGYQLRCRYGWQNESGITYAGAIYSFPPDQEDRDSLIQFQKELIRVKPSGRFEIISSEALTQSIPAEADHGEGAPSGPALVGIIKLGELGQRVWLWKATNTLGPSVTPGDVVGHSKTVLEPNWLCNK